MLLEYGVKNFYSFKEGSSFSFKLDSKCPDSLSNQQNYRCVLGIKGANGSGKTHALKGLAFLSHFCTKSFRADPDDDITVMPFYDHGGASELYVEFKVEDKTYRYELDVSQKEIIAESIHIKKNESSKAKGRIIVKRSKNKFTKVHSDYQTLKKMNLRTNASLISTAKQYGIKEVEVFYNFFHRIITDLNYFSGHNETPRDIDQVANYLSDKQEILSFVSNFITSCDTGIDRISIVKSQDSADELYFPAFFHKINKKEHAVFDILESSGTKAMFRSLPAYYLVLNFGGVLIVDEFDSNLHPHILPKLLNLFLDPDINKKRAQLIFSTHDSQVLDILGRYRTYMINKEDNESYAYRLDEVPGDLLRNDRSILPAYHEGRIGGVPVL